MHETRDLLMGSLRGQQVEKAPPAPRALIEDLTRSVITEPQAEPRRSLAEIFDSLRAMVATPAFGSAAAAVMILGIVSTVIFRPDAGSTTDSFRGASDYVASDGVQIIMIDAPAGTQDALASSFEDGVFSSAHSLETATSVKGAKVIIDFPARTITAINVKGQRVYQDVLPDSETGLTLAIASAVTRL
ncbi:MAG: hypothetical protein AAGB14_10440 [Verrucomicrobiota bacterium]